MACWMARWERLSLLGLVSLALVAASVACDDGAPSARAGGQGGQDAGAADTNNASDSRDTRADPDAIADAGTHDATGQPGADAQVDASPPKPDAAETDVGVPVTVGQPPNAAEFAAAKAALEVDTPRTASAFLARWARTYAPLPYDPATASGLPLIQGSTLKLNDAELATLSKNGLTISARQSFGTFFMGYLGIYANDLPLFISGDSVLHAVHRSYDRILRDVEVAALIPALTNLLTGMRTALVAERDGGAWPAETVVGVDEYLAVALALSTFNGSAEPVAGGDRARIAALVAQAMAASGIAPVQMFGADRDVDFSQFAPRGHYANDSLLEPYFRATMWLGRMDLRLIKQDAMGGTKFARGEFAAAALMAKLIEPVAAEWTKLDHTLRSFVGESDNMTPVDFAALLPLLNVSSLPAALGKSDDELASAIVGGGFGIQRIASQLLVVAPGNEGAPLDRAFLLLGQRFTLDAQVLSNVVYDRVDARPYRLMPNPLDVAFAALGNSDAAALLTTDLNTYTDYPQALHKARVLVDEHEPAYFTESLYTAWLGALRAASPPATTPSGAQPITATDAWARRTLQMQMASWTELRHDNLLYAKQSYTGIPTCSFPDAYVEPNPALWHAIGELARRGSALAAELTWDPTAGTKSPGPYFDSLAQTVGMLEDMAKQQETGAPFTAEQMAFVNQAIEYKTELVGCASIKRPVGWYPQLFYRPEITDQQDTLVADVHTQPADADGNIVGRVLHAGTGFPRLMVVTFETCDGPRAYAGVVSAYHEVVTQNFDRLTDQRWTDSLAASPPAEVPWMRELVSH